ncbi:LOW QUALITY PROTEIN: inhibin beta chain [Drosophila nasuta]|uniref:LOW QUALITY PROTEIN: inhibin beta chain n=1 Tax=Drosophila nasuta TaxID=42062 RepID=UPI00295E9B17|nr:LOW QUALITY PROTEIN: inhibin beta chain [Drosophila nasuta]
MVFDFVPQQLAPFGCRTATSSSCNISSKCYFNCSCFCCRQGCCTVISCCCCYCSSELSINLCCSNLRRSSPTTLKPLHKKWNGSLSVIPAIVLSIIYHWLVQIIRILESVLLLHRKKKNPLGVAIIRRLHSVWKTSPSVSNSANPQCLDLRKELKEQCRHVHMCYDIANDQQLKSNNLCKMFCNNRKRQRRRKRRRRRRRHNNNNNNIGNSKQTASHNRKRQQQPNKRCDIRCCQSNMPPNFSLSKATSENMPGSMSALSEFMYSWTLSHSHVHSIDTLPRHCFKANRNRANFVWLLIGLFWLEVKLINCNTINVNSGGYVSNLAIVQKACTLCQLEMANIYADKDNPHIDYNNNNNNNNNMYNNNDFNKVKMSRIHKKPDDHNNLNTNNNDRVRLESIKRQILTKLGLSQKPNVSHPLPKQFIWETIYRADGGLNIAHDDTFQISGSSRVINKKPPKLRNLVMINDYSYKNDAKQTHRRNSKSTNWVPHNPRTLIGIKSDSKEWRNRQNKKRNQRANAYNKSTYLLDIHRSSDSVNTNSDNANYQQQHDPMYYRNINNGEQIHSKLKDLNANTNNNAPTQYYTNYEEENMIHESIPMDIPDQDALGFEREDFFGNTQEIITFAEEGTQYHQYRIVEFSPQKNMTPNQKLSIRSAQMHLRIEKHRNGKDATSPGINFQIQKLFEIKGKKKNHYIGSGSVPRERIKIWVFRMTDNINITEKVVDQAFLFRASFEVVTDNLGWQRFDMTETIREWYSDHKNRNLRLLIDCTGCGSQYSLHLFPRSSSIQAASKNMKSVNNVNPNRPFLVLHTEPTRPRRVRRRALDCGGTTSGQCCKESFYVSFKALGWDDWIIAPRGYFANYCRGECTGPFRTPDTFQTFHTHFIEEYRKMGLLNGMKPCCAPVKFSSMSLIYYGDEGIIKRDLPKMVVDECGCP